MNWLLARLARLLLGNGLTNVTDDLMDGITLAIEEEFALLLAQDPACG